MPSNPVHIITMIRILAELRDPLIRWFKSHPSPPVAIISDMFLGWTNHLARQLNIRRIVFSPSGAMALSVIYSLWRDMPKRNQNELFSFSRIPNSPEFPWFQISTIYRTYVEGGTDSEFIKDAFCANLASWGLVVNSFTELEAVYLDHLKKEFGHHDHVWAVGPLFPHPGPSSVPVDDVLTWLDRCEENKVVYVCFGSQTSLTNDQLEQLASSLGRSRVKFIWCIREEEHVRGYNMIPSGFEDRMAGRGLIIRGWAPQVLILSHRAVGAFLTHCGWNSVLEGLVAGVPMLAWPMGADQFVNASLLVDKLKVAVRACEGATTVPNWEELARVIKESVSENRVNRERVQKLSSVAVDAIKDGGGSSVKGLEMLVQNLVKLKLKSSDL
ncbi:hypothetical protein GH714_020229 [Hevea brasiliensis]|uniref:anthocyanidin 3-O-glucosyltransferase n=1 Tax=Hevea brasiliensis TaxID=3981 RepID=A0A6A6L3H5_HEVBR|nr:hypothetical protein GH714_020229 [Hevea brasiliensis]